MSLLLDALQRASKDKERAAAGGVASTPPLKIKDTAPGTTYPNLQDNGSAAPAPEQVPASVELSLEAPGADRPAVPEPPVVRVAPAAPAWEMTELTAPPEPVVQAEPIPAPVATLPPTPTPTASPVSAPMALSMAPPEQSTPAATPEKPAAEQPKSARTVKGAAPARVAQEIRRAYVPDGKPIGDKTATKRRTVILGGLALVLALGLGSVLFGVWGDPIAWLGGGASLSPAPGSAPLPQATPVATVEPPAPVPEEPTSSPVPVQAATTKKPTPVPTVAPRAVAAPSNTGRKPPGNTALANDADKPGIVARTRGPGALETGYAALLEGKLDIAAKAYTQALNDNPEERDALLGLAYVAHKRGQREQAQDYYRRVLRQEPGNATASAALLALDNDGDSGLTASRARDLAQQQPDSAAAVALAANALARDGQVAEAAQYFARAQQLEPGNAMHAFNHAVALDRLGQYVAARQQYDRALQLADRGANANTRTFSTDAVRQRVEQLRQAAQPRTHTDP